MCQLEAISQATMAKIIDESGRVPCIHLSQCETCILKGGGIMKPESEIEITGYCKWKYMGGPILSPKELEEYGIHVSLRDHCSYSSKCDQPFCPKK